MTPRRTIPLLLTALLLVGCTASGGEPDGPGSASPTTDAADALDAKAILALRRDGVALVETSIASGSAVLLEDGHLVTNAHVVDPFGVADVTFEGEDTTLDVPVVGVDLDADIAVLGPIETDLDGVTLADPAGLDQGSDLFLVGFPGDQEEPEVTISSGVLSRRREVADWGLDFLQSDTKIAPGQSGGALVDDAGRVIGISGLSDEDDFALTLSGADAADSVDRILAGDGSDWEPAPTEATETKATVTVGGSLDVRSLYLPASGEARTLEVSVTGAEEALALYDVGGFLLDQNELAAELTGDDGAEPVEPEADGSYRFELDADFPALLLVGADVSEPTPLAVTTSEPFVVVAGDPEPVALEPGDDAVEGTLGYLDDQEDFAFELEAGDSVDVLVRSAIGDVAFSITGPGIGFDEAEEFDDGGGGLFDLDAEGSFTAEEDGTYVLAVYQVEGAATGFRLTVEPG